MVLLDGYRERERERERENLYGILKLVPEKDSGEQNYNTLSELFFMKSRAVALEI
jgi:hypothetical protein